MTGNRRPALSSVPVRQVSSAAIGATLLLAGVPAAQVATAVEPPAPVVSDPAAPAPAGRNAQPGQNAQLALLSEPIHACLQGNSPVDPASPLFASCYDWHSSVHAHWALYAITARTGDPRHADTATASLDPQRLQPELDYMTWRVQFNRADNPYGFAWFLRLAREREQLTGDRSLRPLADFAAQRVSAKLGATDGPAYRSRILADNYQSLSWALINYKEWVDFTGDARGQALAARVVSRWQATELDRRCPVSADASQAAQEFFPPCLLRLVAVGTVRGSGARDWISQRLPQDFRVPVYPNRPSGHTNALNFSRAYALHRLAAMTGRDTLRDNAAELIDWQVAHPVWREGYATNAHWLAQFGVLAIDAGYRAGPPR